MSKTKKVGLSPGSAVYVGKSKLDTTVIHHISYNSEKINISKLNDINQIKFEEGTKNWLDIRGIQDVELIQSICEKFKMNRLILEDILDPHLRPKVEDYEDSLFAIIKNLKFDSTSKSIVKEQISIYLTNGILLNFQEDLDDTFEVVRKRMEASLSKTRSRDCDYLLYSMLDFIVDKYYEVVDQIEQEIQSLEEEAQNKITDDFFIDHFEVKSQLLEMKRFVNPLREEISKIKKLDIELVHEATLIYFRDLEDHILHIVDAIDNQRELLNSVKEISLNQMSLEQNKDMKWLAAVSTISIPILFLTGVYGMNFEHMPELKWHYGYLIWWIIIITVVVTVVVYFRKKNIF